MRQVTKEEFYKVMNGPRNVHPTPEKDRDDWKDLRTGELIGKSTPGYMEEGEIAYFLAEGIKP